LQEVRFVSIGVNLGARKAWVAYSQRTPAVVRADADLEKMMKGGGLMKMMKRMGGGKGGMPKMPF
jgi:hypothetical protein